VCYISGGYIVQCDVYQEAILYCVLYTRGLYCTVCCISGRLCCIVCCIPGGCIVRCVLYQGAILYSVLYTRGAIPYTYKFLRDEIFADFVVASLSTKFSSSKIANIRIISMLSNG